MAFSNFLLRCIVGGVGGATNPASPAAEEVAKAGPARRFNCFVERGQAQFGPVCIFDRR